MARKKEKEKNKSNEAASEKEEKDNVQDAAKGEAGEQPDVEEQEEEAIKMVMLPAEDVEKMKLDASRNMENWQRERADFLNYKKLKERDQLTLHARITGDIIKKYLPVLDDMERALKVTPEDEEDTTWREGMQLIYRKLKNIVESEGVTKIPAEFFDPTRHEAISSESSPDHESGQIIEVIQQGYMLKDRVLRPALVRVAK